MIRRSHKAVGLLLAGAVAIAIVLLLTTPQPRDPGPWVLEPPLPAPRGELAVAVANAAPCPGAACPDAERLFAIGGLSGLGTVEGTVTVFDPVSRRWDNGPALPEARHHLAAVGLGQAVYVSGGSADLAGAWQPTRDFWRLDWGAREWRALEPMPEPRWGHRMVVLDGRIYVVGGIGPSASVLIYTPGAGWTAGAALPVQRDHLAVVVAGSRIWAIGGRAPASLAAVDVYDPATDSWTAGPDLPQATSGAAEAAIGPLVFVSGGEESASFGHVIDAHWLLETSRPAPSWEAAPPPPLVVHGAGAALFGGAVVIVGGATRHGALSFTSWTDAVQRLDPARLAR
jgi:hypothetical protein